MIRINRLTDYAIVVLVDLTRGPGVRTAQALAEDTGVPLPTVAKLMKALGKAGIVESHRGALGGYTLGGAAADISVARIIEAIEGPIAINTCLDETSDACGLNSLCSMHANWDRINTVIRRALAEVTLAEMAESGPNPFLGDIVGAAMHG